MRVVRTARTIVGRSKILLNDDIFVYELLSIIENRSADSDINICIINYIVLIVTGTYRS